MLGSLVCNPLRPLIKTYCLRIPYGCTILRMKKEFLRRLLQPKPSAPTLRGGGPRRLGEPRGALGNTRSTGESSVTYPLGPPSLTDSRIVWTHSLQSLYTHYGPYSETGALGTDPARFQQGPITRSHKKALRPFRSPWQ